MNTSTGSDGKNRAKSSQSANTPVKALFDALDEDLNGKLDVHELLDALDLAGILEDDPRFRSFFNGLKNGKKRLKTLNFEDFHSLTQECFSIFKNAFSGELIIPNFQEFTGDLEKIFEMIKGNERGKVAEYIPQLKRVPAEKFAVSVCTVDGQRWSIGDYEDYFSIQSTCKPLNYCLALEEFGENKVHQHVGREPSGHSFNEITLDSKKRPHNPMINAGAIMTGSMVKPDLNPAERFDFVLKNWSRVAGGMEPRFNNSVYLSELGSGDRNFALAYFMKEHNCFPEGTSLQETLEFYFQCCSIELTTEHMAVAGATMAASGLCPLSGEKVFKPDTIKNCLALMSTCGMYDYSGEFFFTVGLPAKSGVGGGLWIVIPNLMGICIWSPALDKNGNSVRGVDFAQKLVSKFNFHNFDSLIRDNHNKKDPRKRKNDSEIENVVGLIWAASQGDVEEVQHLVAKGVDLNMADYDGRTPLHLAAAEGRMKCVQYFLSKGVDVNVWDRWGASPIVDAEKNGHTEIVNLLKEHAKSKLS